MFLNVLCPYLLNLKQLTLTTSYTSLRWKTTSAEFLQESARKTYQGLRGLLTTAAAVTQFHPQMRKAYWRPWRGPIVEQRIWEEEDGEEVINAVCHEYFIDIFKRGSGPDLKPDGAMKDAYGGFKARSDTCITEDFLIRLQAVVLNSPLIRRLVWEKDGYVGDLKELLLPNDTQSSELNMERLWWWDRVAEYLDVNVDPETIRGWHLRS